MRTLAVCIQRQADCQAELSRVNDTVLQTTEDVRRNHLIGVLDMSFLAAHRRFMVSMQRQAQAIMQKIAVAQQRVTEAALAVAEAPSSAR